MPKLTKGDPELTSSSKKSGQQGVVLFETPIDPDQRRLRGPFDIIGDVHGCYAELHQLLHKLGYTVPDDPDQASASTVLAPEGRKAIFVGDLVDRGANSMAALKIVMALVEAGKALCVLGNHDDKFRRWLLGRDVSVKHGLEETIKDFEAEPAEMRDKLLAFLSWLPIYLWLDDGALVVAHAGIRDDMIGRTNSRVRRFCLYGDTDGERDAAGIPIRYHWAAAYQGETTVVYGHTPLREVGWVNNTLCIDTGCCFGVALTALRWPEKDIVSVPALKEYSPALRQLGHPRLRVGVKC